MGSLSLAHWLIVALVVMLVFGPKRLAEAGKGLGQGIRSFKEGMKADDE
ncbi:MAG: twin-arginine translocase TatA/TatE family subunit [Polyangiaceae bacterium]|nr:twin-arginine translocase TatA/TatE family subunit [Myxococcales bacterium]MCB9587032.1 twin-arginine translocase TatA/TatE family subunit [Polyangiaceae bacterium]